ncbi:MAG: PQQ-binding-like beta-propeller repeat protein, partial [Pirellulaceae bacterium]
MQRVLACLFCSLAFIASGCAQEPEQTNSSKPAAVGNSKSNSTLGPNDAVGSDSATRYSAAHWSFANQQFAQINVDRRVPEGSDWTKFLGPQSNGSSLETGVDVALWDPHPPLNWVIPLGTSYGGPARVGNRLLLFDRFGDNERLSCFDTESAQELWRSEMPVEYGDMYGYNNGPRCAPIVDNDLVFTYGVAGQLSCCQLKTGELVWTRNLNTEFGVVQNFFGVASSPYIFENLLLVMVGGSPASSQSPSSSRIDLVEPNGTAVVAFDKKTGEERYRLGDDLASYASVAVEEIHGKPTGLAFLRSGLLAFDPLAGTECFTFPWRSSKFESVNAAMPVVTEDQILLSECYEIGSVLLQIQDSGQPSILRQDEGRYRELSFR